MEIKYGANIKDDAIDKNLRRLINQVYKLLPEREENLDWRSPLNNIIMELVGMDRLLEKYHDTFFLLLCKLESLLVLDKEEDFANFRKGIFESLNLINMIRESICQD